MWRARARRYENYLQDCRAKQAPSGKGKKNKKMFDKEGARRARARLTVWFVVPALASRIRTRPLQAT